MALTTANSGGLVIAPICRPRPLRSGAAATGRPTVFTRLAQQFRRLKIWSVPSVASSRAAQSAARGGREPSAARQPSGVDHSAHPGAVGGRRPGIVWFRGDLRLHDHEALSRAQAECSSLLPVYCFDPRDYGKSPQGYDKTGPFRAHFLAEAVADLRAALRAAGSELVVRVGRPEEVVAELVRRTGAATVYCHTEVTYEELQAEAAVKSAAQAAGAQLRSFWANTLCHLEDLPFSLAQLPQNFDKFRDRINGSAVRPALPAPAELKGLPLGGRVDPGDIPTLQQLGLQPLPASHASLPGKAGGAAAAAAADASTSRGGESEALRQLQHFVTAAAASGKSAAGAAGAAYGSSFSSSIAPWLATGCLSPRRMLEDAQRALVSAQAAPAAAAATAAPVQQPQAPLAWVRFELLWRDFFRFITLKYSSVSGAKLGSGAVAAVPA
ncbi:Blue-light photoreceptor PHR2 [Chlorella vulgaris]